MQALRRRARGDDGEGAERMSYFNDDQLEAWHALERIPPEQRCWCGWERLGECRQCPPGKTCADKMAAWCPECRSAPTPDGARPITHRVGCSLRAAPASARDEGGDGDA